MNSVFRLLRIAHDMTVKDLATKMQVSPSYLSEIESGKKKPSLEMIEKYSQTLGINKSTIFYFEEQGNEKQYKYQELLLKILEKICVNTK